MLKLRYIILFFAALQLANVAAQKDLRMHMRRGDKLYADSAYDKAQTEYLKALEKDTENSQTLYNLGNTLLYQEKANDAMAQYQLAEKTETDKQKLAQIHHNMGVICQASKQYAQAVELYKQSLRENPTDHETRYNLALAMKLLKDQQQEQQPEQQQENEDEISKENAEQLLESAMQDEKDVQEKVKKMMQVRGKKLDKDW